MPNGNEIPHDFIADCVEAEIKLQTILAKMRNNLDELESSFSKETDILKPLRILATITKDSWVAQDEDGRWFLYGAKPKKEAAMWYTPYIIHSLERFNLPTLEDWKDTLYEIRNGELIKDDK